MVLCSLLLESAFTDKESVAVIVLNKRAKRKTVEIRREKKSLRANLNIFYLSYGKLCILVAKKKVCLYMNLEQFAQELRLLIAQGETQEAIHRLLAVYNQTKGEYHDELIVIASHFKMLRDKIMAGTLDDDDVAVQNNAINHSLLQLIDQIDEDQPLRRHFHLDDANRPGLPNFKPKTRKTPWLLFLGIGVVLIVGVFFLGQQFSQREPKLEPDITSNVPIIETDVTQTDRNTSESKVVPKTQTTPPKSKVTPPTPPQEDKPVPKEETPPPTVERTEPAATSLDAEPNNSVAQALPLKLPAEQRGTIADANDRDHFQVNLAANQQMDVILESADGNLNPILEILDASGNSLQRLGARQGNITTFHRARTAGEYYIRVYGKLRTTGNYKLGIK